MLSVAKIVPFNLGELTVDCMDPDNKAVPVNLTDNFDGTYRLRAKPVKPGKHTVNIKLNKHHVLGKWLLLCFRKHRKASPWEGLGIKGNRKFSRRWDMFVWYINMYEQVKTLSFEDA